MTQKYGVEKPVLFSAMMNEIVSKTFPNGTSEIFKWHPDFYGMILVGDYGTVLAKGRIARVNNGGFVKLEHRILKQFNHSRGYKVVSFQIGGDKYKKYVHRLVCETFLDNPKGKPQVNHKDGDKTNNKLSNLEWATNSENRAHAVNNGLIHRSKLKRKFKDEEVVFIRFWRELGYNAKDIAEAFGARSSYIYEIARGARQKGAPSVRDYIQGEV